MDEMFFSFSAATAKTAKLKQKRHNTVHGACQTDYFVISSSIGGQSGSYLFGAFTAEVKLQDE